MNIRQAILAAADHIERNPHLFNFMVTSIPDKENHCGTPGCALGWIGYFAGQNRSTLPHDVCCVDGSLPRTPLDALARMVQKEHCGTMEWGGGVARVGITQSDFYSAMSELNPQDKTRRGWKNSASECARTLRLYADRYHPAPAPQLSGIPDSVLALFRVEEVTHERA